MKSRKRKLCPFSQNKGVILDYKNPDITKYVTESGKVVARRITGTKPKIQRELARSIKIARFLALIPYCSQHDIRTNTKGR